MLAAASPNSATATFSMAVFLPTMSWRQVGHHFMFLLSRQPSQTGWPWAHCQIRVGGSMSTQHTGHSNSVLKNT